MNYSTHTYLPMKMEQTARSETSAYKIHTPVNYSEGRGQIRVDLLAVIYKFHLPFISGKQVA
jgi:hypothetical protein